jgi:acyl transferase domain-containing protein
LLKQIVYPTDHFGVPKQHGFIKDIRKFDATFFNVHPKQAEGMDPQLRILHEVAYESIIDGGIKLYHAKSLYYMIKIKFFRF